MQPSDSPVASAGTPVPLAHGLPRARALVLSRPDVRPCTPGASEALARVPRRPARTRGPAGASQVTGLPSSSVPWSSTPPREAPPRPLTVTPPTAFRVGDPLGFPVGTISGLHSHGPRARLPTHQPPRCRDGCKAGYRPAGLGFGRAGFAPAGQLLRISWNDRIIPSFRTSIAWSHPPNGFSGIHYQGWNDTALPGPRSLA